MAVMVGIAVFAAVIISSPYLILRDFTAIVKASVPLPTAIPYLAFYFFTKFFSKLVNSFPKKIDPFSIDLSTRLKICFLYFVYSLL
jgi:hypothetical protein